ncbi:MAG: hypothetical protein JWN34_5218 [Bryobacterales bacterium]|nr:hypothetical protein [Bryobacterales bacterium]
MKGRPAEEDRLAALQPVLRVAIGLRDDAASKLSSTYYAALAEPFRQHLPAAELPDYIVASGGIEKLVKAERKRRAARKQKVLPLGGVTAPVGSWKFVEQRRGPTARFTVEVQQADCCLRITMERVPRQKTSV